MVLSPAQLIIASGDEPSSSDLSFLKLAGFMGIPARSISVGRGFDLWDEQFSESGSAPLCMALNARTWRRWFGRDFSAWDHAAKAETETQWFVYGFDAEEGDSELVRALSNGAFDGVRPLDGRGDQYCVSDEYRAFCQEFSGLRLGPVARDNDLVFEVARTQEAIADYIHIGDRPFMAGIQNDAAQVTLSGTREILDIDAPVARGERPLEWFSRLIPALMFLRHAFGDRCWHAAKKLACFIVDDPLLRDRHGFLRYDTLLAAMEQKDFATSVAFVPWNYRRSHPRVAELFRRYPRRLSMSIHGCDHTKAEFGETAAAPVLSKARMSRARMAKHRELTGIPCDNVMVFPQGAFSTAALEALKQAGFLAAVNSTPFPIDDPPEKLRVRDLLSPALTRHSSLPLFIRRYPRQVAEFAMDLFLGKPVLMVEHHEYFRRGYGQIESFVAEINRLADGIEWCGLEEIARNSCLWRTDPDGVVHVRLFCDDSVVRNNWPAPRQFRFSKPMGQDRSEPPSVAIDGELVTATGAEGELCFERMLQPGEQVAIKLGDTDAPVGGVLSSGSAWYRAKVFARRHLCELRDNYVCRIRISGDDWSRTEAIAREN